MRFDFGTLCVLLTLILNFNNCCYADSLWQWKCANETNCIRVAKRQENINEKNVFESIEVCRLVCGNEGPFWPRPSVFNVSKELIKVHPNSISFQFNASKNVETILQESCEIFIKNILQECRDDVGRDKQCPMTNDTVPINVKINIESDDLALNWDTVESYSVDFKNSDCIINAKTFFGARHGLETVSQLIASDSVTFQMPKSASIFDRPFYRHRSLLLDSSRNFISVSGIKRQIDGMAASKLNYLHWHISDSQSFPYQSVREPLLSLHGASSSDKIYRPDDINDLNHYALVNGVRIIMEIDAPSHAGNGWQWGPSKNLGELAVCINQQPWRSYCVEAPCGQLNPANENVYNVLENLYNDIVDSFESDIFHMGGDELFFPCWNSSAEIVKYLKSKGKGQSYEDFLFLWGEFQEKALRRYDKVVGDSKSNIILWTSELTDPKHVEKYLDKNRYVLEPWVASTDPVPPQLLEKGYRLIMATKNAWYLDHGFWGNTRYYTWRTVYNNRLISHKNVLGGEVCMWGEFIDEEALDGRVWPRAAAAGERLWSNPNLNSEKVEARMFRHRERLVARKIRAEALGPRWCYQNENQCF